MKHIGLALVLFALLGLTGCAIKNPINNQYKLEQFSAHRIGHEQKSMTILVSQPEAVAGYQTEQMLYIAKPYELSTFAHNAWVGSPANMLFPLIMESLEYSNYFHAVSATPFSDKADYRLDTQILALQQNFLTKPSTIQLDVKVVITHISDNRVLASKIIRKNIRCPADTPYGGVIGANEAVKEFTAKLTDFVIRTIGQDNHEKQ